MRFCRCGAMVKDQCPTCHGTKGNANQRGYDYKWQKLRAAYIKENPLCEMCRQDGYTTAADEVHHRVPITVAPALRLSWDNLQALCTSCHHLVHSAKGI